MRLTIAMLRAVLALPAPAALAAQTGQFVVRLGRDTLAIEQYTRTADRLQGEQVVRSPRTVHRIYTVSFGPGGETKQFELVTHNVSGAPGPHGLRGRLGRYDGIPWRLDPDDTGPGGPRRTALPRAGVRTGGGGRAPRP